MVVVAPPGAWTPLPWFLAKLPALRSEIVDRPHLDAVIDQCVHGSPLTVVAAPSGFGKTVALAAWARDRDDVVWVSATSTADSFAVVRGCLLEALPPAVRARLAARDPEEPAPDPLELIGWLTEPRVLVIDDAHLLDSTAVRHTIACEPVLDSGLLRVVLIGQPVLEQVYSRELASGSACLVPGSTLAFGLRDVEALLASVSHDGSGQAQDILEETGGWPVAVRLRLLGDRRSDGEAWDHDGNYQRLFADYVENVVLERFRDELRTFVLEAAICARTTATLVRVVTGRDDSAAMLAECRRAGMFIDTFREPGKEEVYRWHDTFVQTLRTILARRDPERSRSLHRTAAQALARDHPAIAVEHALLGEDPDLAAEIIRASWLGLLLASHAATLNGLCLQLPEHLQQDPDILLVRACCCDIAGEQEAAEVLRRRAAASPGSAGPRSELVRRFSELYLASDPAEKAAAADRAHALLVEADTAEEQPYATFLLGWVELRLRRDPERAIETLTSAARVAQAHGLSDLAARAHANRAFALTYAGHFGDALRALDTIDRARLARSDWEMFDGGLALFSRGYVHFWRGELAEAFAVFDQMVKEGGNDGSFLGLGRVYFALTASALGRTAAYDEAEYNLSLVSNSDRHGVPWESYKRVAASRLLEARGKPQSACEVAEPLLNREGLPVSHALLAEAYRRMGEPSLAHIALRRITRRARPRYAHVAALVTAAALQVQRGQEDDAHKLLERALHVAEPDGAWYPFLARDRVVTELLESHRRSGHAELLLAEVARRRSAMRQGPGETLTAREREILDYLRTSMTTQEIAEALHLSLNTVKTHLRSIYRKLDVPNRRSAVRLMS